MIDERVEDGHDEEHVGRRIAGAAVAVEVVADKVARTQKEMPKGVRQGTGADAPHVHDVQPHHPPCDAFVASSLPAVGAVVAGVGMAAVGAYKYSPIFVFADECQNLRFGKEDALTKLLTEGRKFGVNLILATQYLVNSSAEAQRILQAGLIMYFQPTQNKIRETAGIIDSTRVDEWVAQLSSLKRGEFVAVGPIEVGGKISKVPLKVNAWLD